MEDKLCWDIRAATERLRLGFYTKPSLPLEEHRLMLDLIETADVSCDQSLIVMHHSAL